MKSKKLAAELEKLFAEYLETLNKTDKDDYFKTEFEVNKMVLDGFLIWLSKKDAK